MLSPCIEVERPVPVHVEMSRQLGVQPLSSRWGSELAMWVLVRIDGISQPLEHRRRRGGEAGGALLPLTAEQLEEGTEQWAGWGGGEGSVGPRP